MQKLWHRFVELPLFKPSWTGKFQLACLTVLLRVPRCCFLWFFNNRLCYHVNLIWFYIAAKTVFCWAYSYFFVGLAIDFISLRVRQKYAADLYYVWLKYKLWSVQLGNVWMLNFNGEKVCNWFCIICVWSTRSHKVVCNWNYDFWVSTARLSCTNAHVMMTRFHQQ